MEPRVVVAPDEVQSPAVEPCDDERAIVGEGAIDVGRGEAHAARPDREARTASVLRLHGQQPLADSHGIAGARAGEKLRGEARTEDGGVGVGPGHEESAGRSSPSARP